MQMQEGEESYPLYKKERDGLLSSLKRRAEMIEEVCLRTAELLHNRVLALPLCMLYQTATSFLSLISYMAKTQSQPVS